jgi:transglutaminase-like putative cysteine protease
LPQGSSANDSSTPDENVLAAAAQHADRGQFTAAEKLLEPHIADLAGPVVGPYAEARETLRRIRHDYALTAEQALEAIRKKIPDATAEDVERWTKEGVLQHRVIDGEMHYFRREPANLLRFSVDAKAQAVKEPVDPQRFDLPAHLSGLVALAEKSDDPETYPVQHEVTHTLTISQAHPRMRVGAVVRCWLPFPKEYRQQKDVKLIGASPGGGVIAPNDQPQRTIYFEHTIDNSSKPLVFTVQFEFTTYAYYPKLDPAKAQVMDQRDPMFVEYTAERLPHIAFTPRVREIVEKVAASEPNPLLRAKKLYLWTCENMRYCAEMEYGTIASISDKGLTTSKGDCGVQGLVFITLCRAAGIPARWQSGFETLPRRDDMHDWAEFYVAPWGWLPADPSYGLQKHDDPRIREFYFGHLDPYRMIVNTDYARPLYPPSTSLRAEPNDFQRGEVEIDGHNLYFDEWDWKSDVRTTPREP